MSDREEHCRVLADHFSTLTSYWKDIYTSPVEQWDFFHHAVARKRKVAVLDFVDRYARGRNMRILDTGCGAGVIMEDLLHRGHQVCGVDISPDMLRETSVRLKNYHPDSHALRVGTVEGLDFPDWSFDLCLCIGVLQYLEDDELALKELARVIKPGGQVIICLPNFARVTTLFDPYYYICRAPRFILYRILHFRKRDNSLTSRDILKNSTFRNRRYYYGQLRSLFRRLGLEVRSVEHIGYGPLTFWAHEYLSREFILRVSEKIERLASKRGFSFLKVFADRWVMVLEKKDVSS